eukprot:12935147-Alexandrium_andersonii.AAC.1
MHSANQAHHPCGEGGQLGTGSSKSNMPAVAPPMQPAQLLSNTRTAPLQWRRRQQVTARRAPV